ncbi:hypothetical protein PRO82_001803 [Candidatus Protochlamydia amoebophila]|nr:hypothetical protein [Candidatus Protochlamydia amoebophila]
MLQLLQLNEDIISNLIRLNSIQSLGFFTFKSYVRFPSL